MLRHTYTRLPKTVTSVTRDVWNLPTEDDLDVNAIPLQPCLFIDKGSVVQTPVGIVEVDVETIIVPWNMALLPGDSVSHVQVAQPDNNGPILMEGPLLVGSVTTYAPAGGVVYFTAELTGGRAL